MGGLLEYAFIISTDKVLSRAAIWRSISPPSVETVECARVATGQSEISLFTKHIEMAGQEEEGKR